MKVFEIGYILKCIFVGLFCIRMFEGFRNVKVKLFMVLLWLIFIFVGIK